jgi:hypothetical protein
MSRSRREIEQAFRRVRWQEFLLDLRHSWAAWGLVVAAMGWFAYYSVTPQTVVEVVHGTAIGAHQPASEDNSARMRIAVQLDANRIVTVPLPRGVPYREGSQVEVEVIRGDWPPHSVTYRFAGYSE